MKAVFDHLHGGHMEELLGRDPRIVDQNINALILISDGFDRFFCCVRIRHIKIECMNLRRIFFGQFLYVLFKRFCLPSCTSPYTSMMLSKLLYRCPSDAPIRTCDDCDFYRSACCSAFFGRYLSRTVGITRVTSTSQASSPST